MRADARKKFFLKNKKRKKLIWKNIFEEKF